MIQDVPRCFLCKERIEHDPVFAPPLCEHQECSSATFHGICLMEWRERREAIVRAIHERLGNIEGHNEFGFLVRKEDDDG